MHRHSAWTILGVDPATQRAAEELAAQEGMSVGALLQRLLFEHASSKSSPEDSGVLRQRLVPLFQDIVEAIGTAAQILAEQPTAALPPPAEPRGDERQSDAPSFQEIQDWLRRVDASKETSQSGSMATELGRTLLRHAG